jgi:hypothetical protein
MTEAQPAAPQAKPPTSGTGPRVNKRAPAKRAKNMFRQLFLVPNPAYNPEQPQGPGNVRRLVKPDAPSFKHFVQSRVQLDEDFKEYVASKMLARESGSAFRKRNSLPPKPVWVKKVKQQDGGKKKKDGKKGKKEK